MDHAQLLLQVSQTQISTEIEKEVRCHRDNHSGDNHQLLGGSMHRAFLSVFKLMLVCGQSLD
jgi:hypothetical protein